MYCFKRYTTIHIDGYLRKLRSIKGINEWVLFYMTEALQCYNANCYNAATVMIGLSSEVLTELIIEDFSKLLWRSDYKTEKKFDLKGKSLKNYFDDEIKKARSISSKYHIFSKTFNNIKDLEESLRSIMDNSARETFVNFIRLNRNEVSHFSEIKKEPTEVLLMFISFIKYCDLVIKAIVTIKGLNCNIG